MKGVIDMIDRGGKFWAILIGVVTCLVVFMLLNVLFRKEGNPGSASSSVTIGPPPVASDSPDDHQNADLVQIRVVPPPPSQAELPKEQLLPPTFPQLDKAAVEMPRAVR
jgi:hypothetical protein